MNLHAQLISQMSRNISNFLFPIKIKHDPLPHDHDCDWGDHRIDIRRVIPSPTRDCILLPHNCNLAILTYLLPIHHLFRSHRSHIKIFSSHCSKIKGTFSTCPPRQSQCLKISVSFRIHTSRKIIVKLAQLIETTNWGKFSLTCASIAYQLHTAPLARLKNNHIDKVIQPLVIYLKHI